jgi:hypothetical protein
MPPERAALYTGIEASRRPHDQLLPEDEVAVRKFDSINPVPSIFCEDAALSEPLPTVLSIRPLSAVRPERFRCIASPRYVDTHLGHNQSRWHARQ